MLLRQDYGDPDFPIDPRHLPSTPNYSDDAIDDCLMSDQEFQFSNPFWTLNAPLFENQPSSQQPQQQSLPFHQGFASYPNNGFDFHQQHQGTAQQNGAWQLYGDGNFNPSAIHQALLSPQARVRQHRRALSNSTATSQASTSSPLQYPAAHDGAHLEAHSQSAYQGYPTPSHTPTQDSFADRRNRLTADLSNKGQQRGSLTSMTSDPGPHSMASQMFEYPATPNTTNGDYSDNRQQKSAANGETNNTVPNITFCSDDSLFGDDDYTVTRQMPALGRTIPDVYSDELFNPLASNMPQPLQHQAMNNASMFAAAAAAAAPQQQQQQQQHHHSLVNDRLQAVYEARASSSPMGVKREPSPFRPGSPYAMSNSNSAFGPVATAAGQRRQQKAEADARAFQQHHMIPDDSAPKTISPQQAYLDDFHDPAEDASIPLFQQASTPQQQQQQQQQFFDANPRRQGYGQLNPHAPLPNTTFNTNSFQAPAMPSIASAKQSPTPADLVQQRGRSSGESNDEEPVADFPAHLISMETSKSEPELESSQESEIERPASTTADSGSYTCTYHNCTQRFASPALLQRHKREVHRPSGTSSAAAKVEQRQSSSSESPTRNTQAGPHRCDRINPSTGKPCNTAFSRPYDLTRHEDTIHARRGKVQCQYCTEEKVFSRADALTRHMRVVHPTIDFPGKHRRRAAS